MYRLLLVDDEDPVLCLMSTILLMQGYEIIAAHGGEEAWKVVEGLEGNLDLVVTDIQMPMLNGLDLADAIHRKFPHLPILFVSGVILEDRAIPPLYRVVTKPFSISSLSQAVQQELDAGHQGTERK